MKFIKKVLLVFIAAMAGLAFVSCGATINVQTDDSKGSKSNSDSKTATTTPAKNETTSTKQGEIKLKFWTPVGKETQQALKPFIEEFNKQQLDDFNKYNNEHKDAPYVNYYTVELDPQTGGYNGIKSSLQTAAAAGTLPAIAMSYPDVFAAYMSGDTNQMLQLDDFMSNKDFGFGDELNSQLNQKLLKEGQSYSIPGTWSLPVAKSTELFFYNKTVFDQAGVDPTQLTNLGELYANKGKLVQAANSIIGQRTEKDVIVGIDSPANLFITALKQMGLPYTQFVEEDGAKYGEQAFANEDGTPKDYTTKVVRFVKQLYDNGILATKTELGSDHTSAAFLKGQVLAAIGSSAGLKYNNPYIAAEDAKYGNFDLGVIPVPEFCDKSLTNSSILQGPSIAIFRNKDVTDRTQDINDRQNIAAFKFVKMLLSSKAQAAYMKTTPGYMPVNKYAYEEPEIQEILNADATANDKVTSDLYKTLKQVSENLFTTNVFTSSGKVRDGVDGIFNPVLTNDTLKNIYAGEEPSYENGGTPDQNQKVDAVIAETVKQIINNLQFN